MSGLEKRIRLTKILGASVATVLLSIVLPVHAATMHAIFIGDTADPNIGVGVESDIAKFSRATTRVAEATGFELSDVVIKGSQFRSTNLRRALAQIRVKPDDVVMLVYSGHGKGEAGKTTPWPYLALKDDGGDFALTDFADVMDEFHRKGPRFMLAIVDACNNYDANAVGTDNDRESGVSADFASARAVANLKKLFLGSTGYVVAAAASPNEFASGPVTGGLLVNGFLRALSSQAVRGDPADWTALMNAATQPVERRLPSGRVERQSPFYRIDVAQAQAPAMARKDLTQVPNPQPAAAPPRPAQSERPPPPVRPSETVLHVERRAIVRVSPSGGANELRVLEPGEAVAGRLTQVDDSWYRIEASEGWSGYVFGRPFRR